MRANVAERAAVLIGEIERGMLGLTGAGEHGAVLSAIACAVRELKTVCLAVHDFAPLLPTLEQFEVLLVAVADGRAPLDDKFGGVGLHLVSALKSGVHSLGTDTRAARMLPKILQDLTRVMGTLLQKNTAQDVSAPEVPAPSVSSPAQSDPYREMFLRDDQGLFHQTRACAAGFASAPPDARDNDYHDRARLDELFRLVHTIKGNAMAVGLEALARYAHALEDVLGVLRSGAASVDLPNARALADFTETLQLLRAEYRGGDVATVRVEQKMAELKAFHASCTERVARARDNPHEQNPLSKLASRAAQESPVAQKPLVATPAPNTPARARTELFLKITLSRQVFLVSCEAVSEVLRNAAVLAVPGGRKGWLGVVRVRGDLVPLFDAEAFLGFARSPLRARSGWVVVLRGEDADKTDMGSRFSILVDDVAEVVELPRGGLVVPAARHGDCAVLDLAGMATKLGADAA